MAVVIGFGLLGFDLMSMSEHGADPRNIRGLFHAGVTGGLTDEQLLARSWIAKAARASSPSRSWSPGMAQWCCASARMILHTA